MSNGPASADAFRFGPLPPQLVRTHPFLFTVPTSGMETPEVTFLDRGRVMADWNFVIETPERTILWDTGSHPEAGDGYWPAPLYEAFAHVDAAEHTLEGDLADAGFDLGDIDAVVMSHLHLDHAGGLENFAGTDVPIYVHREELPFAYYSAKTDEGSI